MIEYMWAQNCRWCWIGYEKHGQRYRQRGQSPSVVSCVRRCIRKIVLKNGVRGLESRRDVARKYGQIIRVVIE